MAITDWPKQSRPREKLLAHGASSLSDQELLAIFLRTGSHGVSAVELAGQLIGQFGSLSALLNADKTEFLLGKGLGEAKYAQLRAVLELSARHSEEALEREFVFTSSTVVKNYLHAKIKNPAQERFHVLFLDSQNRLIRGETLFTGSLTQASIYTREIVKRTLSLDAQALIVAHNHPSGIAKPSTADIEITKRIQQALELIDAQLVDHLIVAGSDIYSLAENGQLNAGI